MRYSLIGFVLLWLALASCGDDTTKPMEDIVAPAPVENLAVDAVSPGTVTLRWRAPGDDGNSGTAALYDIRYATFPPSTQSAWDSAIVVTSPPTPKPAGTLEYHTILKLRSGTWYFRMRAKDENGNRAGLSNVVSALVPGVASILRVTDLTVTAAGVGSVALRWTAPGNQATELRATAYDLRYSTAELTDSTWNDAVRVFGLPEPAVAGTLESFTVTGLGPTTAYNFALQACDEIDDWSGLSNIVREATVLSTYARLTWSSRPFGAELGAWSPDGGSIAFMADWKEKYIFQVYRMSASGGNPTRLTDAPEGVFGPAWSPDGTKIAFVSMRKDHHDDFWDILYDLAIMDPDPGASPSVLATYREQSVGRPSWSPDGSHLAYEVRVSWSPFRTEIYTISATGGVPVLLAGSDVNGMQPSWSPDGTKIAFSSNLPPYGIRVMPVAGGEPVQLIAGSAAETMEFPSWSPDGAQIAYVSAKVGGGDIWIMSSTGANPTRLTGSPDLEYAPSWSPDGRSICVSRVIGSGRNQVSDLWILRL